MLTLLMHIRTTWSDFFTGNPTIIQSNEFGERQTPSATSIHVSNCLFRSITSTSSGGALYCSSVTYLLIESSSFFSCKTSSNGGAIYFINTNSGQSVLYEVCGYDCYSTYTSTSEGQFAYIYAKNAASNMNYVNYSSITRCVIDNSVSRYTLRLDFGKQCCLSVNISMNKCYYRSGICCQPFSDSNSFICSFSYSTFADNNATGYNCIYLLNSGSKYKIESCNILRNTQGSLGTEGTIHINGNIGIENSCILGNKATYIFYQGSSYTITLSNCTVDLTSNNGKLTTRNTVTKSFILALNHMSTRNCHSEYDAVGILTPIIQSSSNKQINCFTIVKCFLHPQLRDVVSLTSILFFNFIHHYAYCDPMY
jgi:hypothetical protein